MVGLYRLRLENVDDKGLQVRRGEWPSTLNNLMRERTAAGHVAAQRRYTQ